VPKSSHMPGPVAVLGPCHGSLQVAGRAISGCLSAQCGPGRPGARSTGKSLRQRELGDRGLGRPTTADLRVSELTSAGPLPVSGTMRTMMMRCRRRHWQRPRAYGRRPRAVGNAEGARIIVGQGSPGPTRTRDFSRRPRPGPEPGRAATGLVRTTVRKAASDCRSRIKVRQMTGLRSRPHRDLKPVISS
jgi:hypothetical protein